MKGTTNYSTVGFNACTATVLAKDGNLTTLELVYPRIIHSELMTHRMFSRNAMSSRATPVDVLIKEVEESPFIPVHWTLNQSGMVGVPVRDPELISELVGSWELGLQKALYTAKDLQRLGVHKQIINRVLEPYSFIKVVVTATDWDNFFKLRLADDAEPHIRDLALAIKKAKDSYKETYSEAHLPYVKGAPDEKEILGLPKRLQLQISAARCARVSYFTHKEKECNIDKDLELFNRLWKSGHMSPMEHACVEGTSMYYANLYGWRSLRYILEHEDIR